MKQTVQLIIIWILVIFSFSYSLIHLFKQKHDIAFIDSSKLFAGYKGMVEVRQAMDKKRAVWQANVDTLSKEVTNAIKEYEKIAAKGTDRERIVAKNAITGKQKQLYDYQNSIQQNASAEEQQISKNAINTVNAFLIRYGRVNGYKMILIAANGNMAYGDPSLDITEAVVEQLNSDYVVPGK